MPPAAAPWTTFEPLIPTNTYTCLEAIEKRCPVYRCGPSLFVSYLRAEHESASAVTLNCMSRDAPRTQLGALPEFLHAHEVTVRIPPYKDCTDQKRSEFLEWLKTITHLRSVFIFSELFPSRVALSSNNMVSRTLRYMGKSTSAPKRIVVLEPSITSIIQLPIPRFLTEAPTCIRLVAPDKDKRGGMYVINLTSFTREMVDYMAGHRQWLDWGVILNLAPQDLPVALPAERRQLRPGPEHLPLKSEQSALEFYSQAFKSLWQVIISGTNVLIVDTGRRYHAATLCAMALTLAGGMDGQDAARIVQHRLQTIEFDGYNVAALAHVADTSVNPEQRIMKAYECLAARYAPRTSQEKNDGTAGTNSNDTPTHTPMLPSDLMKGLGKPAISDHWKEVEAAGSELPRDHFLQSAKMVQTIFNNVLKDPTNDKYRHIRRTNAKFGQWLNCKFGTLLMEEGGWILNDGVWDLPATTRLQQLRDVLVYLSNTL